MRLDYFVCSNDLIRQYESNRNKPDLKTTEANDESVECEAKSVVSTIDGIDINNQYLPQLYDSYMLHNDTVGVSDHGPAVLVIKV